MGTHKRICEQVDVDIPPSFVWEVNDKILGLEERFIYEEHKLDNFIHISNIYSCKDDYLCKSGNQYCLDMEYSFTSGVTSKTVNGWCGYDYGESPV